MRNLKSITIKGDTYIWIYYIDQERGGRGFDLSLVNCEKREHQYRYDEK